MMQMRLAAIDQEEQQPFAEHADGEDRPKRLKVTRVTAALHVWGGFV